MNVSPKVESFVSHFGEMGSRWGINRTVGQIYALLVATENPLNADEISSALSISRSNTSMALKELQSWRLIMPQHFPGDRKEYYKTPENTWQMAQIIFEERRKRELQPTLSMLRQEILREPVSPEGAYAQKRMQEIHDLLETMSQLADELQGLTPSDMERLRKLGPKLNKFLNIKDRLLGRGKKKET